VLKIESPTQSAFGSVLGLPEDHFKSGQADARLDDHPITGDQMAAIGNQIDAAFVFARSDLVNVCDPEKTQTMKKPMTRSRAAKKKR